MKYIDAEKLIAEIERRKGFYHERGCGCDNAIEAELDDLLVFITSLQQEQSEVDLVAKLKHHLDTTPKEQLEKEWKELEPWCNIGPTVQEFLYGKQPEVDLEKAARYVYESWNGGTMDDVRRDMVELGKVLNARKEE